MKTDIILVGNKFILNKALQEYVLRKIQQKIDSYSSITYFKEGDNTLFLHLQSKLESATRNIVVTTKQNYSTVGKVLCTIVGDNQVLKDDFLIPQSSSVYEKASYLLEHNGSLFNVLFMDEMQEMPQILFESNTTKAYIQVLDEDKKSVQLLLTPIAQTYDVFFDVAELIEGWCLVEISSKKYGDISNFISSSKQLLPKNVIASSNIAAYIIERLSKQQKRLSFAESCTGGLLSYFFTKQNGASKIFDGSLVTYSNHLKENWLAVNETTLIEHGAVSDETVYEMSEGVMNVSEADYSLSISGVAGDEGGTEQKPVGTVFIGARSANTHKEIRLHLVGDRNYVQCQSVLHAVKLLLTLDKEMFF